MRRALISVADKRGICEFAAGLSALGYEIISTGSTHKMLNENGIPAVAVEDYTGFPEMLGGRVKTLHPKIHGGILVVRDDAAQMETIDSHGINAIDIVVNNLYPFKETIKKPGVSFAEAVEQIDIGGPSMLRAAAKNHRFVTVLCDPNDYETVLEELNANGNVSEKTNLCLAAKVFAHTAHYDAMIADYMRGCIKDAAFPETLTLTYEKLSDLRYGENPHQRSAVYREPIYGGFSLAGYRQLGGKEMSFCNFNDAQGALDLLSEFEEPAAVAVKHATPCGVSCGENICEAFIRAKNSDPKSIMGGIVALNREVDFLTADELSKIFLDIVIAPSFSADALKKLSKKRNLRLIVVEMPGDKTRASYDIKKISGGLLVQEPNNILISGELFSYPTKRVPTETEAGDLIFAWKIVKHVRSNGIAIARKKQSLGIGGGQVNRVWAAQQAVEHCKEALGSEILRGASMASDAMIPFPDCVEVAREAGITAIIQTGGSVNDAAVIEACDKYNIAMAFTGTRHFKH